MLVAKHFSAFSVLFSLLISSPLLLATQEYQKSYFIKSDNSEKQACYVATEDTTSKDSDNEATKSNQEEPVLPYFVLHNSELNNGVFTLNVGSLEGSIGIIFQWLNKKIQKGLTIDLQITITEELVDDIDIRCSKSG